MSRFDKVFFMTLKTRAGYPEKISKGESKKQRNFTKGSNKQGILLNPNEVQITLNALNKHGRLTYLLYINSYHNNKPKFISILCILAIY